MRFVSHLINGTFDVLDTKHNIICPFKYTDKASADSVATDFNEGTDNPADYGWDNPDGTDATFVE